MSETELSLLAFWFLIALFYLAFFGGLTAVIAVSKKRNGFSWFFLGVGFGPFALLAVNTMPPLALPDPPAPGSYTPALDRGPTGQRRHAPQTTRPDRIRGSSRRMVRA